MDQSMATAEECASSTPLGDEEVTQKLAGEERGDEEKVEKATDTSADAAGDGIESEGLTLDEKYQLCLSVGEECIQPEV